MPAGKITMLNMDVVSLVFLESIMIDKPFLFVFMRLIETQNCEFTVILQQNEFTSTAFKNDYRPLGYIHSFGRHFCQNGIQIR